MQVRKRLESSDASGLSGADLITAMAAASVRICGGPDIPVFVGRTDATCADPENRLPEEAFSAGQLKAVFGEMGFSAKELVCLSGAHTLGTKGFGAPDRFDNAYYIELLKRPWEDKRNKMASMIGLPSDHVLPDDAECLAVIRAYAADEELFMKDFASAFTKLAALGY
jgi:L-ascorbate peroxidase